MIHYDKNPVGGDVSQKAVIPFSPHPIHYSMETAGVFTNLKIMYISLMGKKIVCRFVIRHITQTDTETETELLRRHIHYSMETAGVFTNLKKMYISLMGKKISKQQVRC